MKMQVPRWFCISTSCI